jgi:hypothetical protein
VSVDELPLEPAGPALRERDLTARLRVRYSAKPGRPLRFVYADQVRSHAGWHQDVRVCDFLSVDTWPRSGLAVHGHEIKTTRGNWLDELREPAKAGAFLPYCNYWWIVAPEGVVHPTELPTGWGLLLPAGWDTLRVAVKSTRYREARPMPWTMSVALMRATWREHR